MPRSRWQALRLLLVCAVLALTSAAPRSVTGWFESVVQVAYSAEVAAQVVVAVDDASDDASAEQASRPAPAAVEDAPAFSAPSGAVVALAGTATDGAVSRLYIVHCALLC